MERNTIPYKGTGPAMNDLLGGQVDLLCDQTTQTVPMIKDGRVKVFGVTTLKRLAVLPDVPTLISRASRALKSRSGTACMRPRERPAPVLEKINAALRVAMQDPTVKQRLCELGSNIAPLDKISPVGLKTHLEARVVKWSPVIKKAGIYADQAAYLREIAWWSR